MTRAKIFVDVSFLRLGDTESLNKMLVSIFFFLVVASLAQDQNEIVPEFPSTLNLAPERSYVAPSPAIPPHPTEFPSERFFVHKAKAGTSSF
jgi:hypothetical protein